MFYDLVEHFVKVEGVNEQLKTTDSMLWVRKMNSIHNRAKKITFSEMFV